MVSIARPNAVASPRSTRLRGPLIALALLVVGGALAVLVVPRFTSTPARVELDSATGPVSVTGIGSPRPSPVNVTLATPAVAREAVGDGDDVPKSAPADFEELRFTLLGLGFDSIAPGSDVRDAILARPGTYVRYRTEAVKKAFLEAKIRCPLEARPMSEVGGTRLDDLRACLYSAGFDVLYRPPLFRIGARTDEFAVPK